MDGDAQSPSSTRVLSSGVVGTQAESQVATLDERTGPFFDAASLPAYFKGGAAALTASVQDGDVLAVESAEGLPLSIQHSSSTRPGSPCPDYGRCSLNSTPHELIPGETPSG